MTSDAANALKARLDEIGRRVDAKIRELKERGQFTDVHEAFNASVRKRQAALGKKVDAALAKGTSWDLMEAEFERDLGGLSGEMLQWVERMDTEAAKKG
jgi:hypothetical protein